MDFRKLLGADYRRLEIEGKRVQTIEDEFNSEIEENLKRTIEDAIDMSSKGFTPDFDIEWLKEVFERHALITMITAYKYAESEKQYRGKPTTKRFALPRPRLPRNLKDLMKIWDSYQKKGDLLKRSNNLYEKVRKQYLRKLENVWKVHGKDFIEGKTSSKEEAIQAILKTSNATLNRAKTIIATETTYYQNKARTTFYDATPEVTHYLFLAIRDKATTPWCSPNTVNGLLGRHVLVYEKGTELQKKDTPAVHWNCLLPDQMIKTVGITKAIRSYYSGQSFQVFLKGGTSISCTGNHPILTTKGWIAANKIKVGDKIVRDFRKIIGFTSSSINQKMHSRIEDFFESVYFQAGTNTIRPKTSETDFYGDGLFLKKEIDVVLVKIPLIQTLFTIQQWLQNMPKRFIIRARSLAHTIFENSFSSNNFCLLRQNFAFSTFPSSSTLSFNKSSIFFNRFPFNKFLFALSSQLNRIINQKSFNSISCKSESICDIANAFAISIKFDKLFFEWRKSILTFFQLSCARLCRNYSLVHHVDVKSYNGYVYDVEINGLIELSDGSLVSNCRSELTPLVPFNPNHKKLIDDKSLRRENHKCTPLPPGWQSR